MPTNTLTCSLCQHEIPAAFLRSHQERENKDIIAYTVELIKQSHPDWSENDPTCQKCWEEFRAQSAA